MGGWEKGGQGGRRRRRRRGRRTHAADDKGRHEPAAAADHAPEVECGCGDEEEAEDYGAGFAGAVGVEGVAAASHVLCRLGLVRWEEFCSLAARLWRDSCLWNHGEK